MKLFQLSIREILFLVALIAVAILMVQSRISLSDARLEVKRLKREVGELEVVDNKLFHAIQVPTKDVFHWRWRISLPDGYDCYAYSYTGLIPDTGYKSKRWVFNSQRIGSYDDEREFFLDLKIGKNYRGRQSVSMTYNNESSIIAEYEEGQSPDWLDGRAMYSTIVCGDREVASLHPESELFLLRIKTVAPGSKSDGEGVLVWLSTTKHQTPRIETEKNAK